MNEQHGVSIRRHDESRGGEVTRLELGSRPHRTLIREDSQCKLV
jgi:hypothetical protein